MITWTLNPCSRVQLPDSPPLIERRYKNRQIDEMEAQQSVNTKSVKKRLYRKRVRIFNVINKIKLWPSRNGSLHGIRTIEVHGNTARLTTHCNKEFHISNSRNSRAGRWLRNKWFNNICPDCRVPEWKIEKYAATRFKRHQGSMLMDAAPHIVAETTHPDTRRNTEEQRT